MLTKYYYVLVGHNIKLNHILRCRLLYVSLYNGIRGK